MAAHAMSTLLAKLQDGPTNTFLSVRKGLAPAMMLSLVGAANQGRRPSRVIAQPRRTKHQ
jgi:hypothetical protein